MARRSVRRQRSACALRLPDRARAGLERRRRVRGRRLAARLGSRRPGPGRVLGGRAVPHRGHRPGAVRAGPLGRTVRPHGHDLRRVCLRVGAGHGRGVHRRSHRHPAARRYGHACPLERSLLDRGRLGDRRHGSRRGDPRACCRPTPTSCPPCTPVTPVGEPRVDETLHDIVPDRTTSSYDVRRVAERLADDDEDRRAVDPLGAAARDRTGADRRPAGGIRGQPAAGTGRNPRHQRITEGRTVRALLRRVQPPAWSRWSTLPASFRARTSSGGG